MVHKPSVRSVHATAQELAQFSAFMATHEGIREDRRAEFAGLADRLNTSLAASGRAFYGGIIGQPTGGALRRTWETSSIDNLETIMREAMPTLRSLADADPSGSKYGTGYGINRVTSQIVYRDVKAVLDNERNGAGRDPGAYVDNPLMGIVQRDGVDVTAPAAAKGGPQPVA